MVRKGTSIRETNRIDFSLYCHRSTKNNWRMRKAIFGQIKKSLDGYKCIMKKPSGLDYYLL